MPDPDADAHLPLTQVVFHTLLCLVDEPLHGYAIAQEVERVTDGRVTLGPGTLYGCLHRLADLEYIEECGAPPDAADTERRRYYRLRDLGRAVLEAEARRLQEDVRLLRARKVIR